MPISTRKANTNTHPSHIVLETQQPRRTKKQVDKDASRAKAAAIAEREEKEVNRCTVLATIADMEDTIKNSKLQLRIHTIRPDLHPDHKHSSKE